MRYLHYRTFVRKCPYRKTVQKEPRNFYEVPSENYILGEEYVMLFGPDTSHRDKHEPTHHILSGKRATGL